MIKVGNYLWHPEENIVIKVTKIIEKNPTRGYPWFGYEVIIGAQNTIVGGWAEKCHYHNGWDYYNMIGNEFILIHKYDKEIPSIYRLLYGH